MSRFRRYEYSDAARMTISPAAANVGGLTGQVAVPLFQSVISGAVAGLVVGLACWAFASPQLARTVGLLAGVVVFGLAWAVLLDDSRSLLRTTQTSFQPGASGAELQERLVLVNPPTAQQAERSQAEARRSRFADFVRAASQDTSQRRLEQNFSRDEVQQYRDVLLRLRLAKWRSRDKRRGWELCESVDVILARVR